MKFPLLKITGLELGSSRCNPVRRLRKAGLKLKEARSSTRSFSCVSFERHEQRMSCIISSKQLGQRSRILNWKKGLVAEKDVPATAPDISQAEEKTSG